MFLMQLIIFSIISHFFPRLHVLHSLYLLCCIICIAPPHEGLSWKSYFFVFLRFFKNLVLSRVHCKILKGYFKKHGNRCKHHQVARFKMKPCRPWSGLLSEFIFSIFLFWSKLKKTMIGQINRLVLKNGNSLISSQLGTFGESTLSRWIYQLKLKHWWKWMQSPLHQSRTMNQR